MPCLDCTFLADGSSDAALLPILEWTIRQHVPEWAVQCQWADLRRIPTPPRTLGNSIAQAVALYPCHLLLIHRDAEAQAADLRYREVAAAMKEVRVAQPHVCVVPVRMQEAWLLLDPEAIRHAAGNPNGRMPIILPPAGRLEALPDPKSDLYEALRLASGLGRRRLKRFQPAKCARLVPDKMSAFGSLRQLAAFRRLEEDIRTIIPRLDVQAPARCSRYPLPPDPSE